MVVVVTTSWQRWQRQSLTEIVTLISCMKLINMKTWSVFLIVMVTLKSGIALKNGIAFVLSKRTLTSRIETESTRYQRSRHRHPSQSGCFVKQKNHWSLRSINDDKESPLATDDFLRSSNFLSIPFGASLITGSFWMHADGWTHLYSSFEEMKSNSSPSEFSSALQFWLFGALSHRLLNPIIGVSEILHASPGTKLAGLVPISFVAMFTCGAWILVRFQLLRNLAGITAMALLISAIGAGLDGRDNSLLGDYNIQLDDSYQGKVVKGCPAPDGDALYRNLPENAVFDYQRYQGRWYWHEVRLCGNNFYPNRKSLC